MYARLGSNCHATMDTLTDSSKFIPLSDPIYNEFITVMYQYPSMNKPFHEKDEKKPKVNVAVAKIAKNTSGCCGSN